MKRLLPVLIPLVICIIVLEGAVTSMGAKRKAAANNIEWSFDPSESPSQTVVNFYRVYVDNVLVADETDDNWGDFHAPAGSTVRFEVSVPEPFGLIIDLWDQSVPQQLFYQDIGSSATYSFTVTADHRYTILANEYF